MSEATPRSARLETRIAPETLSLAKRAAEMEGRSLSDFVAAAIREVACRKIEEAHVIRLSLDGQRRFADLLADPPEPGAELLGSVDRHRRLLGEP